jgi:hypothetical protein
MDCLNSLSARPGRLAALAVHTDLELLTLEISSIQTEELVFSFRLEQEMLLFCTVFRPSLRPIQPLSNGYRRFFPRE